jgi:hypothetical protein
MAVNNALENLEENLINCAYWDFSVKDVDGWNGEDFSLFDREGRARGLNVNVRPSITRLRGYCAFQHFDPATKKYTAHFKSEPGNPPTVIRIPKLQFPDGFRTCLSDGWAKFFEDTGELWFYPGYEGRHHILLKPVLKQVP